MPQTEQKFYWTREERKMVVGSQDVATSKRFVKPLNKKQNLVPVQARPSVKLNCIAVQIQQEKAVKMFLVHNFPREQNELEGKSKKKACDLSLLHVIGVYYLTAAASVASGVLDDLDMIYQAGIIDK